MAHSNYTNDVTQRFTLDKLDIRGQIVHLGSVWQAMQAKRNYPDNVSTHLGHLACVSVLLGSGLKFPGRVSLQINTVELGQSQSTPRAVLDCTTELGIRGMARVTEADTQTGDNFCDWIAGGSGNGNGSSAGTLAISILQFAQNRMHQSVVPISGLSVAECFEHYFDQSEQLPTHLWLAASETGAAALLLQKLPNADLRDADGWARVEHLAASVRDDELINLPAAELLSRLFAEEDVRLYEPKQISYACKHDREKVNNMLRSLGKTEVEETLAEQGIIEVSDDICNEVYRYTADDVAALFAADGSANNGVT
jgi:molecular chaperone Hsp33